jgi:hypothetical protein
LSVQNGTTSKVTRRMTKALALNIEPYRLWYEFLNRAKARGMKVSKDYVEWGDTNIGFRRWWTERGSSLITVVANGVDLANSQTLSNDNYYLFAIPKHLSPRQTRDEAEQLMKRLKAEHGQIKLIARWNLSQDAAPKLESYRSYLHALDCYDKLIKKAMAEGKTEKDVKLVEVLGALRLYYIKKHERYKGKGDFMPQRLTHGDGGHETDPSKIVVSDHSHPKVATQSINAVRDYLKKSNEILERVAKGSFP